MNTNITTMPTGYVTNEGNGLCPECGTELHHICLTCNPPINKVECPNCGYTKDIRELTIDLDEIYNIVKSAIKVKKLRQDIQLPKYGSDLASGFDVRAYDCVMFELGEKDPIPVKLIEQDGEKGWLIPSNRTVIFKTGLAMACGQKEEIQARARSGFSLKTPMRISNGIGTIDEDFRGEIGIIMDNNGFYGDWFVPYAERVAQLVVCPIVRPSILEVEDLDDTQRGEGGYGSTGTK